MTEQAVVLKLRDVVYHKDHGYGTVCRLLGSGEYFVEFVDYGKSVCRYSELQYYSKDRTLYPVAPPKAQLHRYGHKVWCDEGPSGAVSLPDGTEGRNIALRILEAMRTGVVGERVELYTIGRVAEMKQIDIDLGELKHGGAVRVVLGDYGAGKTHMLECIEAKALNGRFLTARITLNGKDVSPGHPQRVYRALMLNLLYPDRSGKDGLMPLFSEARRKGVIESWLSGKGFHEYLSPALYFFNRYFDNLEKWADDPEHDEELRRQEAVIRHMLDWLEGQEAEEHTSGFNHAISEEFPGSPSVFRFPALRDYRTFGHIYTYILSGISALARQSGYSGLVLLLDEAEMYNILSCRDREYASNLFGYYAAMALGEDKIHGIKRFRRGGHLKHRRMPVCYTAGTGPEGSGVYCVFAMTMDNGSGYRSLCEMLDDELFMELHPLSSDDYKKLCAIVIDLYRRAYPDFVQNGDASEAMGCLIHRAIEKSAITGSRQILRCILELLDYSRLCRSDVRAYVTEMSKHIDAGRLSNSVLNVPDPRSFADDEDASAEEPAQTEQDTADDGFEGGMGGGEGYSYDF